MPRSIPAARFGEQAQDFQIEPDQRDHDAEGAVPLHVFRCAYADAGFDEVEVEHQVERGDDDHNHAEADADGAVAVDGAEGGNVEEAEHHLQ